MGIFLRIKRLDDDLLAAHAVLVLLERRLERGQAAGNDEGAVGLEQTLGDPAVLAAEALHQRLGEVPELGLAAEAEDGLDRGLDLVVLALLLDVIVGVHLHGVDVGALGLGGLDDLGAEQQRLLGGDGVVHKGQGQVADGGGKVLGGRLLGPVEHDVGAELLEVLDVGGARVGDDPGEAGALGHLDGVLADGRAAAEDDDGLALAGLAAALLPRGCQAVAAGLVVEGDEHGDGGQTDTGGLFVGDVLGRLADESGGHLAVLLESRVVVSRNDTLEEDSVALSEAGDLRADGDDLAGGI